MKIPKGNTNIRPHRYFLKKKKKKKKKRKI